MQRAIFCLFGIVEDRWFLSVRWAIRCRDLFCYLKSDAISAECFSISEMWFGNCGRHSRLEMLEMGQFKKIARICQNTLPFLSCKILDHTAFTIEI